MIKKTYILTIILLGITAISALAQGSSQATMRVSVNVVSGSSFEVEKPEMVYLSSEVMSELGSINLKGAEEGSVIISNSDNIVLQNKDGHQLTLDIESERNNDADDNRIKLRGKSLSGDILSSVYQGEVTTSIEYF